MSGDGSRRPTGMSVAQGRNRLRRIAELLGHPVDDFYRSGGRSSTASDRRFLLYESANGDRWSLTRGAAEDPVVRHVANAASGGHVTDRGVGAFLAIDLGSPQHAALLRHVGELVSASLAEQS